MIKKIVQDRRWEKFTESYISRKISKLLKTLTGLIFSLTSLLEICNGLYSDGLIKLVWLGENTRKEESHKLNKEVKAGICYLNPPNEINNFLKNKQGGQ